MDVQEAKKFEKKIRGKISFSFIIMIYIPYNQIYTLDISEANSRPKYNKRLDIPLFLLVKGIILALN